MTLLALIVRLVDIFINSLETFRDLSLIDISAGLFLVCVAQLIRLGIIFIII